METEQNLNPDSGTDSKKESPIILIGNANVGKSVIFGLLTGQYVVVSNYPGTTVEISRGTFNLKGESVQLIDTPGIANLLPMSDDEMVTRDIIIKEKAPKVLQVADAKNLERTLLITLQLAEMGLPFVLDLNMCDEARERRIDVNINKLKEILKVPVVSTIAVSRTGMDSLRKALETPSRSDYEFTYSQYLEDAIEKIVPILPEMTISARSVALMILAEDRSIYPWIQPHLDNEKMDQLEKVIRETRGRFDNPLGFVINNERLKEARRIVEKTVKIERTKPSGFAHKLGKLSMHNVWGIPILLGVLYLMYFFVGDVAAGQIVDYFESTLFGEIIVPAIKRFVESVLPIPILSEMLVGEYGLISVGITYAVAIVLPIVTAFFLFFGLLEDSGYLPRLAIISNKLFSKIGLNGKAVLPMILGLGCGTMATISSRILDTKKERLLVILLLSLGIPCSAQLGVIMGMMASMKGAFLLWLMIIGGSIFLVGWAANKVLPEESSDFILEIPPLRIPSFKNIFIKTFARIIWYLKEAVPLFLIATFVLFILDKLEVIALIQNVTKPIIVNLLGLPPKATEAFIVGFLRRDYGAAGLMDMSKRGLLTNNQVLISMVTITLFLPCVAQFFVIIKEKGWKVALMVSAFVLFYAFAIGGLLNYLLTRFSINL